MTDVFAKRRFRLRAMKKLMDNYLPADQLIACPKCLRDIPIAQKEENLSVCPHSGYHWPIGAKRRLEILKDTHVGAFAVMACAGYLLLTAGLLSEADAVAGRLLAPCFVFSRAMSATALTVMKSARPGGMLDGFARAAHRRAVCLSSGIYAALCIVLWLVLGGPVQAVACLLAAGLCALGFARMAQRQFGGITGDLAGWLVQVTELCLTAVIVMGGMLK